MSLTMSPVLLSSILTMLLFVHGVPAELFDEGRFEKEILVQACSDPMQLEARPDGRVYFIERNGNLKLLDPEKRSTRTLGRIPAAVFGEVGLLGLALDLKFDSSRQLFVVYCPESKQNVMRLSRFTLRGDRASEALDPGTEKVLLEYGIDVEGAIHMGGGLILGPDGLLLWGAGDNCPPIPELPVDQRPGKEISDALRSAANSRDLRGKVLRIRPEPDGSYSIPEGNLFPGGKDGRPEIFAMGCRNPFRVTVDPATSWVYWGDVGPNVQVDLGIGPNGYDEINQARAAGNFGWPMFVGPNEAFAHFDFAARKVGTRFDAKSPENDSRNNTGLKLLPAPQPAFIWYPTGDSREFPELGSGGRSVVAGPVYHFDASLQSDVKLPDEFDNTLFIADWTRNWIKAVKLDSEGRVASVKPFLSSSVFRKPIELKLGPDGTLLVIEYGDKWNDNADAQIVRLVYRRGNRAPVASIEADTLAGKQPLVVKLSGAGTHDRDVGDTVTFAWDFGDGTRSAPGASATAQVHTYEKPGVYTARLSASDSHGATSTAQAEVRVGNARPRLSIAYPPNGGFFDWKQPIRYEVTAQDEEDGSTIQGSIPPERVVLRAAYRERLRQTQVDSLGRPLAAGDEVLEPGLALMRRTTCFSCHTSSEKSAGPPYLAVAQANLGKADARERLARKVVAGGGGVWGPQPMPPHPQHTIEETRMMVDWVLSLATSQATAPRSGTTGAFTTQEKPKHRGDAGVYVVTASYTDRGTPSAPPLTGEAVHVLHARRKRAAFFDARSGAEIVDELEGEAGIIANFASDQWISFESMDLKGVTKITCRAAAFNARAEGFELRADSPTGPFVARIEVPHVPGRRAWREVSAPITNPGGVRNYFFVARGENGPGKVVGLNWIDFLGAPALEAPPADVARAGEPPATAQRRPRRLVRDWTCQELLPLLGATKWSERSVGRGSELFQAMSCSACHSTGGVEGGALGPDLSECADELATGKRQRLDVLRDILEPSSRIHEKFKSRTIVTKGGEVISGLVTKRDAGVIRIAWNAADPKQVREIAVPDVESEEESQTSLMPAGLVSTLAAEEILDLLAFIESRSPGGKPDDAALDGWLENMVAHHRFAPDEVAQATGLRPDRLAARLEKLGLTAGKLPPVPPAKNSLGNLQVLPYPGGRHPRIGFLEGAVHPWRETKLSVFLPWEGAGYAVIDLPEALWSQLGLTFLAHQHIPTVWDLASQCVSRHDWTRSEDGFGNSFILPNGLEIHALAAPRKDVLDMELRLRNGSATRLTGLRTQICLMLKGAPDFNSQTNDNKVIEGRVVATRSKDGNRWIATVWQRAKPWANAPCPCMHSDPTFPDLEPGAEATLRGRIFFFEGPDIRPEIARREKEGTLDAAPCEPGVKLESVRKIWDAAPHSAFTDLVRFRDEWVCVFREGQAHVSPDGAIRVLASRDGESWQSVAVLQSAEGDLRDPKITIAPDGRLLITTAAALNDRSKQLHQSLHFFSTNGRDWSQPIRVGDPDIWLWRTQFHRGVAYGLGYATDKSKLIRLYRSADGQPFEKVADNIFDQGEPNESALAFLDDGTCHCLLRRDDSEGNPPGEGIIGTSISPYTRWTWKGIGARIGGPNLLRLADGRFIAAGRLYDGRVRTSLAWVDPENGAFRELLAFPSGGDTSYPGLVEHQGKLFASYYSSHEGKASIYFATVKLPAGGEAQPAPRLRVSENRRFLVKSDGKPFFWLGDTAWELFHRLTREEAELYLRDRASKGFTVIQAVALAELDGLHDPNAYGHTPLENDDPTKPKDDYFRHVDWIVDQAASLGLFVGFLPTWGDKVGPKAWGAGPEIFNAANAEVYGEWLGRRYRDKPLVWILGGDRNPDTKEREAIWRAMASGLRRGDGGSHLITFHPTGGSSSSKWFHADDWLDFNLRQNGHCTDTPYWAQMAEDYSRTPVKPVIDGEPIYEDHPICFDAAKRGYSNAADVRRALYWDLFAGAFGHTYGNHAVWQMYSSRHKPVNGPLLSWDRAIEAPGSAQMQHARALLESRPFLTRVPDSSLVVPDPVSGSVPGSGTKRIEATRDADGSYAIVYVPSSRRFRVDTKKLAGAKLNAWWFNPRDGKAKGIGTLDRAEMLSFEPPDLGENMDWVLVLDDASKGYGPPGGR